jgi:hypothetical protein
LVKCFPPIPLAFARAALADLEPIDQESTVSVPLEHGRMPER